MSRIRHIPVAAALVAACLCAPSAALAAPSTGGANPSDPKLQPPKKAKLTSAGKVIPPAGAPKAVVRAIEAGNRISNKPYVYGGGHKDFAIDSGYDCSGAVSYVLEAAKPSLLETPLDALALQSKGVPGKGKWITWYGNNQHGFIVVAGLRFDTGYNNSSSSGPRWTKTMRPTSAFTNRHISGL